MRSLLRWDVCYWCSFYLCRFLIISFLNFRPLLEFLRLLLNDSISIFTILNPLSAGVIMLSLLEEDVDRNEIRQVALKSTKTVFLAMLIIFGAGVYIFDFFGIAPSGLKVFGGIILILMAFNMVQGNGKRVKTTPPGMRQQLRIGMISVLFPWLFR